MSEGNLWALENGDIVGCPPFCAEQSPKRMKDLPWSVWQQGHKDPVASFAYEKAAETYAKQKNAEAKVIVKIWQDTDYDLYEEDLCQYGKFVCWHKRRNLGYINYPAAETFLEDCDNCFKVPIYIYDHSGIALSTSPFSCAFDSGQVGFWVFEPGEIERVHGLGEEGLKKASTFVEEMCRHLTAVYNGDVWGYVIERGDGERIDSCWGFVGDDDAALENMKGNVEKKFHAALEEAWEDRFS